MTTAVKFSHAGSAEVLKFVDQQLGPPGAARVIRPDVWKTYPLSGVVEAHPALEGGQSRGAITLDPR
ncbi:hypothetical protein ACQKLX_21120 [Bosea sp. NPDC003192]|uniref:hypothetical protein n=1 Tax=Bosea sp. NPDC003192 TaxID=3390551 RepID=UPI003D02752B